MNNSSHHLEVAYAACLSETVSKAPLLIERWHSDVSDVLRERCSSSTQGIEKRHLQTAALALDTHKTQLAQSFIAALTSAVASDAQVTPNTKPGEPSKLQASRSFDDLELMGYNQVQDTVDRARVLQTVAMVCEAGLAAFSARLSTAQGFAQVEVEKNPLRPEIFSQALLTAAHSLRVDNAIRSLWFSHGSALMGKHVQALYLVLNELLIERGVAPAAYRVINKDGYKASAQSNVASVADSAPIAPMPSAFAPLAGDSVALPTIAFPQQEREHHQQATQALLQAKQRDFLARNISAEILNRPDFIADNQIIAAFLTGPWSQVLANERLVVDADKTGMYKAIFSLTLGELLWSLNREQTARYSKRLAKLSPSILERLQGGLVSIGASPVEYKVFFKEVLKIHQSFINSDVKPVLANAKQAPSELGGQNKVALNALFDAGDSAYGINSWLAPLEHQAEVQFQRTQPFLDTAPYEKPAAEPQIFSSGSVEFRLGAWVDLFTDDQWVRAQLTWISLYNTLFMFTSAGGRTHSMTQPLLQYLLLQNLVKVIRPEGGSVNAQPGAIRADKGKNAVNESQAGKRSSRLNG